MLNVSNVIKSNKFIVAIVCGLFQKEIKPIFNVAPVLRICVLQITKQIIIF